MPNDYYVKTGSPVVDAPVFSATFRTEFNRIEEGFDKLPGLAGNAGKLIGVNPGASGLAALDASDELRAELGLAIGTDVQAYASAIDALSSLTAAASRIPYFTSGHETGLLDFLDEDDLASDSDTGVPSQQSVKAFTDTQVQPRVTSHLGDVDLSANPTEVTGIPSGAKLIIVTVLNAEPSNYSKQDSRNRITVGIGFGSSAQYADWHDFRVRLDDDANDNFMFVHAYIRKISHSDGTVSWIAEMVHAVTRYGIHNRAPINSRTLTLTGSDLGDSELDRIRLAIGEAEWPNHDFTGLSNRHTFGSGSLHWLAIV